MAANCSQCGTTLGDEEGGWRNTHGQTWCDRCYETESPGAKAARARYRAIGKRYPRMHDWSLDSYPTDAAGAAALAQGTAWIGIDIDDPTESLGNRRELCGFDNLWLHGPVGSGKTGLAWSLLRYQMVHEWEPGDFVNTRDLFADCRAYFSGKRDTDPLEGLDTVALLILDDVGGERPTEYALDALGTLVERRYTAERCTIVTSNYSPSGLIRRLGRTDPIAAQRIVSRLVESCLVVEVAAADRRLAAA